MKKILKFLRNLLWTILILAIMSIAVIEALVFFDVIELPSKEELTEWIGKLKTKFDQGAEDSEPQNFQNISGVFTDRKISDEASALAAIEDAGAIIGIKDAQEELADCKTDIVFNDTYYRFQQEYKGIPIYGRSVIVAADQDGNSLSLSGNYLDYGDEELEITPEINEEEAVEIAKKHCGEDVDAKSYGLTFYSLGDDGIELAWQIYVNGNSEDEYCFVSAVDGDVIQKVDLTNSYTNKEMLDDVQANYQINDEGLILLKDTDRNIFCKDVREDYTDYTSVEDVSTAKCNGKDEIDDITTGFRNLIVTYDFFKEICKLKSFDGKGSDIYLVYLNKEVLEDNAMGNIVNDIGFIGIGASNQMKSLGNSLDVVGHEYTHIVIKSAIGELGNGVLEAEALNEGISDILGNLTELYSYGEKDNLWKLSEDSGWIKYSMEDPIDMTNIDTSKMNPHELAQVISHAAYLMYKGFDGMEALSMQDLASLYYETLFLLPSDCTFVQFSSLLQNMADIMVAQGRLSESQRRCVSYAMDQVGIESSATISLATIVDKDDLTIELYGADKQSYDDYTLYVKNGNNEEKYSGKEVRENGILFAKGIYQLRFVDNRNVDNVTEISVVAVEKGGTKEISIWTEFGIANGNDIAKQTGTPFAQYVAAAQKVRANGAWSEKMNLEADVKVSQDRIKAKSKVTMNMDSEISNYIEDDLSQLEVNSQFEMEAAKQKFAGVVNYHDGTAYYQFTEPNQKSYSIEMDPNIFNFKSVSQEGVLEEKISNRKICLLLDGDKAIENGLAVMQQMGAMSDLECGDIELIATLTDAGAIDQIEMNFDASLEYQGYDADASYKVTYTFTQ